jgi:hypothetical protein
VSPHIRFAFTPLLTPYNIALAPCIIPLHCGLSVQPTSISETLVSDVTRCSQNGVVVSYLHADSKVTPLFTM